MPNWCYTSYVVVGEEREVKDLHTKMKSIEESPESLVPNGFGKQWMGNLVTILGGNWEEIGCRGEFETPNLDLNNDLRFSVISAWAELEEIRKFISSKYPSLKFYYYSEESGCCIYETNDREGKYFPERYILDLGEEIEYYNDIEEVYKDVEKITGKNPTSIDELENALNEYEEEHEDTYFNFYEIEVVN